MADIRKRDLPLRRKISEEDRQFMQMAIDLSIENVDNGGGPFGAVIVKDGRIVATGVNRVVPDNDPTAHAEMTAIREACRKLEDFRLDGCTIYSSCEPCPMCLSAIYWSGATRLCYGCTKDDAGDIEFSDAFIYDQLTLPYSKRSLRMEHFMRASALQAFRKWDSKPDKVEY